MEQQRTDDDFWLIQYQKLIDQRGVIQQSQASIDPILGYNFLLNGVIHVVPFLLKVWNKKDFDIERISDDDLLTAGIKNAKDRTGVLKSIRDFLAANPIVPRSKRIDDDDDDEACCSKEKVPTAPQESITKSPTPSASSSREQAINSAIECVVCMDEQTRVIFLPCGEHLLLFVRISIFNQPTVASFSFSGHLCCCIDCAKDLNDCPMCRGAIERKIKVIQA
jgi:E3 ubiquitin-protein ligase LRSAM1